MRVFPGIVLLFLLAACGGKGELGESCDQAGGADQCVDGAVCTNLSDGALTCLKMCTVQEDCLANENCNGVSGTSIKSCQPKS